MWMSERLTGDSSILMWPTTFHDANGVLALLLLLLLLLTAHNITSCLTVCAALVSPSAPVTYWHLCLNCVDCPQDAFGPVCSSSACSQQPIPTHSNNGGLFGIHIFGGKCQLFTCGYLNRHVTCSRIILSTCSITHATFKWINMECFFRHST